MRDTSRYMIDGERLISVTEVLKMAGLVTFPGVPERILAEAAERGRRVHTLTAQVDQGAEIGEIDSEVEPYLAAYERFRADTTWEPELIEYTVIHRRHRYAGTIDRVGKIHGSPVVLDIKTGLALADWVPIQLAGYQFALEAEHGEHVGRRQYGLLLRPDSQYRLVRYSRAGDRSMFLAALRVAQWIHTHRGGEL